LTIESYYGKDHLVIMDVCQSGFHDQKLQKRLVKAPVEGNGEVFLCDFCLSRMIEAQEQGGDLTMNILYQWAKELGGNESQMPETLIIDCMNRCHLVQFVNEQLFKTRTTNIHFPKILLHSDERQGFVMILEEDIGTIQRILTKLQNKKERGNIALRLWTGCICAAKECRRTSVAEHNPDGTTKREILYTPERRNESFKKIMITCSDDPIYEAGVEAAPVWELVLNAGNNKKMYLDGVSNLNSSPVTRYLKDRNKTIISAEDIAER
jgi:hypothetical protein